MIVLNRKRIVLIVTSVFLSMFVFMLSKNSSNIDDEYIETVSLPVSGKVIVIDAGHGIPDEGAESSNRNNRSQNEFKNCIKITKFIRAKWMYSHTYKVR